MDFALDYGPGVSRFVVNGTEIPVDVIDVDVTASKNWQERPFSLSARFLGHAAAPPDNATADPNDAAAVPEPDGGGFPAWAVVAVVPAAAGGAIAIVVTRRRRSI